MNREKLSRIVTSLVIIGALFLMLWFSGRGQDEPIVEVRIPTSTPKQPTPTKIDISQISELSFDIKNIEVGNFKQEGKVTLKKESNNRTRVVVEVNKISELGSQPVTIQEGNCPAVGEVLFRLNNLISGVSETVLNSSLEEIAEKVPLSVNIHKSFGEKNVFVSCGEIKLKD